MEKKTFDELVDRHKEITAKLEDGSKEDLEDQRIEIQEQMGELENRYKDICQRKRDKEVETKKLYTEMKTIHLELTKRRREMVEYLEREEEEAEDRLRRISQGQEDRQHSNLEENAEELELDRDDESENLVKESEDMRPRFKLGWARQGASMEANMGSRMEANMGAEMGEMEAIKSKEERSDVEEVWTVQDDDGERFEVGDVVWGLRYGKRLPAVVVRLDDIPQSRRQKIKSDKETVLYIKWVNLLDKSGNEVFAATEREKLVRLGDTHRDKVWAERVGDKYQAAKAMIVL